MAACSIPRLLKDITLQIQDNPILSVIAVSDLTNIMHTGLYIRIMHAVLG